ncbi:ABC transporter substrate-binding protein [Thermofilum pendens]|uniref:Extracellular ligand-binding receptor n=1 Tax=Thermofilum pendens (strain DSM 2475 / Hrk 5) TaxID=368408 RepID=A1S0J1_THEPD|nr:ABC transporter substrate-binding protein [Thermofilum pendens]ABL78971.1 Extracellular ligand-binding receptor [Thermofilum pendens Hrk 5]
MSATQSQQKGKFAFDVKLVAVAIIALIVGVAIGAAIFGGAAGQAPGAAQQAPKKVYTIGFTLPLTGELSSIGKIWEKVVYLAIDDLNKEAQAYGFNVEFKAVILDDGTTPEKALQNVQTLAQQGIKVIIGPAASSQVKAVKGFVDSNQIVLISPSSTAPTLAIPGDFIFRTVGSDAGQARVLATLAYQEGARKVIVFHRNDEYGNAFADFFKKYFSELGGSSIDVPYQTGLSDYAAEVASLASKVQSEKVDAVVLISFDTDGGNILSHAAESPVLSSVRWFVSEGPHGAAELKAPAVGAFAAKTKLLGTRPLFIGNPLYEDFKKRLKEKYGVDASVFCDTLYDAVMLAGWAMLRAGSSDGNAIRSALIEVAKHYYGVSGWAIFDEAGDKAYQDYGVWAIVKTDGGYDFKDVGVYERGSIVFTAKPYP